jgi:hypothetical protein
MRWKRLTVFTMILGLAVISMGAKGEFKHNERKLDGQVQFAPTFTLQGTRLLMEGVVTGLDHKDEALVVMSTTATAEVDCKNPAGKAVKGQRESDDLSLRGVQRLSVDAVKHGEAMVEIQTNPVLPGMPEINGCPNDHWQVVVTSVEFIDATVEVYQGEAIVFQQTFGL